MKASVWQTVLLAGLGASIPYLGTWIHDPGLLAILTAMLVTASNLLRSPADNPPTMIAKSDPNQLNTPH